VNPPQTHGCCIAAERPYCFRGGSDALLTCSAALTGPSPRLVKELRPLLERYKVAFYLNGHDHNAQHIHTHDAPATEFITAGAGSPVDPRTPHSDTVKEGAI
jgi:hypothetical protein